MSRGTRALLAAVAVLLGVAMAMGLTGCGQETKTLQEYLEESPSAMQDVEESLAGLNNADMDVSTDYKGNEIIITGDLKTTYKKSVLKTIKKSYKKNMAKTLTEPMEEAVVNIERDTGITGVTIRVIINNGNGKEIWSEVYPLSTEDEAADDGSAEGETE